MSDTKIQDGCLVIRGCVYTGADELRLAVSNMGVCSETFLDRFTAGDLIQIHRMLILSDWEIYPDMWDERQIQEALKGKPPRFDEQERPIYED